MCDERNGDDERAGRASRRGIRLKVDVFLVCGGDFCAGSGGFEDEPGSGLVLEDGPGWGGCSRMGGSRWQDPLGSEVGNALGLMDLGFRILSWIPLATGGISSEDAVEGGESDEGVSPTIDAGLRLPFAFTPFDTVSFEGVVDGENVFPFELRLLTLDGRDGGLTMGVKVADKPLECRFDCWKSVRRRSLSTLSDRPCKLGMAQVVVASDSSPPSLSFRERAVSVGAWPSLDSRITSTRDAII